jgi:signal peptidase II
MQENQSVNVIGDFFRLSFRKNPFLVFSQGSDFPPLVQTILFILLPLAAIVLLLFFYFREKNLKQIYRLPLAAIIGGGVGNLIDRIVREGGVIDFFDFKFYGILGFQRWPTFNVADMTVVVSVGVIIVIGIIYEIRKLKKRRETPEQ